MECVRGWSVEIREDVLEGVSAGTSGCVSGCVREHIERVY